MGELSEHPVIWNLEHTGNPDGRRSVDLPRCDGCSGEFYADELTEHQGKQLCLDCEEARLWEEFSKQDGQEFIRWREHDFYLDWWFHYLSDSEKLNIVKNAFLQYQSQRPDAATEDIREYAFGCDYTRWKKKKESKESSKE